MKIVPKPMNVSVKPLVTPAPVPRNHVTTRAYQQLVTSQNVPPDRAKRLLEK
jgi:hypothetical protein